MIKNSLERREQELIGESDVSSMRLQLLTGQKQLPEVNKAVGVINIIGKRKGFGAILTNIRKAKTDEAKFPTVESPTPKPDFESPRNISELIAEFQKLPKLYPTKPQKKRPETTTLLMQQYDNRQKERQLAMNHGTRARIKRAEFHCNSLTGLYVPTKSSQKTLLRKTSTVSLPQEAQIARTMRRAVTH